MTELPPNLDVNSLADQDIMRLGLDPRPSTVSERQQWQSAHRPSLRPVDFSTTPTMCESNISASKPSPGWSGRLVSGQSSSNGFTRVAGSFQIPTFPGPCQGTSGQVIWDGIGGWTGPLAQTGIGTGATLSDVYSFIEIWPMQGAIPELVPSVGIGDQIAAYTTWGAAQSGGTIRTAYWTLYNLTTGAAANYAETVANSLYDGSSVEWINERPQVGSLVDGSYEYFRPATTTFWWNETAVLGPGTTYLPASTWTNNDVSLTRPAPSNKILGTAAITSTTNHQGFWKACS
jgi:Peptidase A4 family